MCGLSAIVTFDKQAGEPIPTAGYETILNASKRNWTRVWISSNIEDRTSGSLMMPKSVGAILRRSCSASELGLTHPLFAALGHVRLSIIYLSPDGRQWLHDQDNDIHAVVNGEFYDYEEIRQDLQLKGYKFTSESDSEIAIALYKHFGLSFLSHLRGEFTVCLYDAKH